MGLREVGKSRRRRRILDAARDLIESGGAEGFSIKSVAEAAELSVATLYNLFSSRDGILSALLMESIVSLEARLDALAPESPIDRIAAIARMAVEEFTTDEAFYRPLLTLVEQIESRARLLDLTRRCVDLGHECIGLAIEAGDLRALVDPRVLAHQIFMTFIHALRMWSSGSSSSALFAAQVTHFRTLILAAVANEPLRGELQEQLRTLDGAMRELVKADLVPSDSERQATPFTPAQGATR